MMIIRTYSELMKLKTFEERYDYLRLSNLVGQATFGSDRYLNQMLYTSKRWKKTRDDIIIRDKACDLGVEGYDIFNKIIIHHMNPLSIEEVEDDLDIIYDPEFLITTTLNTHNAVHFGDKSKLHKFPIERKRNDTCPWK